MIWYVRISTSLTSAISRALRSGRTLNPMMVALDAAASCTSFSVIPPTPRWMNASFEDEVQRRRLAPLHVLEDVLQPGAANERTGLGQVAEAQALLAGLGHVPGGLVVG